jgi:hypothetical protein
MIKAAIDRILGLAEPTIITMHDTKYSNQKLERIRAPREYAPDTIKVHTLTGLRDFFANEHDMINESLGDILGIHILSHKEVNIIGQLQPDNANTRFDYAKAVMDLEGFSFNQFMDLERFIIALQSHFVPTEEIETILDHLGSLASEQVKENKDDGFSQTIQVRVGIRMKSNVTIKNPIVLNPWRTFREIEQPPSNCILRLKESGGVMQCALYVADGNAWQLEAIEHIKAWLETNINGIPIIA